MNFQSPWGDKEYKSTGMGYVDDVTLACTTKKNSINNDEIKKSSGLEEQDVIEEITMMGQNWEKMLYTNGGRLELKKCYIVMIAWKWVQGIATLKSVEEINK